jgi:RNA polymerase sigma-70 factor (ECF subfamily)
MAHPSTPYHVPGEAAGGTRLDNRQEKSVRQTEDRLPSRKATNHDLVPAIGKTGVAMNTSDETAILQKHVLEGNTDEAVGQLMHRYQTRLERIVGFRMDRRLQTRIDACDIVQETFFEAVRRLEDYRACADSMSFFLWLRFLALQKLCQMHRRHLGVAARDARRDVPMYQQGLPQATSMVLAARLLGNLTSPSVAAQKPERKRHLEQALAEMEDIDREVLALRHFEQLSNREAAGLLQLSETAASNRYVRALKRLKSELERLQHDASGFFLDD